MDIKPKIIIIGAGPGGYEAAITAAKNGADVTIIEKDRLGGVCLNQGCIPTKIFLSTAQLLHDLKHADRLGIKTQDVTFDFSRVYKRKDKVVRNLARAIEDLFNKNGIKLVKGKAKVLDDKTVEVKGDDGTEILKGDAVILATGSHPVLPEIFNINNPNIFTSNELLDMTELPESIIIIGGNIVACEVGQYLSRFGVKVTIIEALDHIFPFEDQDVSKELEKQLKKDKVRILSGTRVETVGEEDGKVFVTTEQGEKIFSDKILVCIGRSPNLDNLGIEELGIEVKNKKIVVDDNYLTNIDGIYAIGDIIDSPMLAHAASHEGIAAVNHILGLESYKADNLNVPRCIYTDPEIASIGLTETDLLKHNVPYEKGLFDFKRLGKAQALGKTSGFIKILTSPKGKILGVNIVGEKASELLPAFMLLKNKNLAVTEFEKLVFPHPTLSEAIIEAERDIYGMAIHK